MNVATTHADRAIHNGLVPANNVRGLRHPLRFSLARRQIAKPSAPRPARKPPWVLAHASMIIGRIHKGARLRTRNRKSTDTNRAKHANVKIWGRNKKNRATVDADNRKTGVDTNGSSVVTRMAAYRKYIATPPTRHFRRIRPGGPATRYAIHSRM